MSKRSLQSVLVATFVCTLLALSGSGVAKSSEKISGLHPTTIHFKLVSRLPAVQADVDGKSLPLLLDLGGFASIALTTATLETTSVKYTGKSVQWRNAAGEVFATRIFSVNQLSIGKFKAEHVDGTAFQGHLVHPLVGYVGFGLLRHYLLVFDYPDRELRIYSPASTGVIQQECGDHEFHFDIINGVVQTKIMTERGELLFQLDTGTSINIIRPSVVGMNGKKFMPGDSYAFSKLMIGKTNLGRTRIELKKFVAPDVDGVLGTDFFESKVLCIDPARHIAAIKIAN